MVALRLETSPAKGRIESGFHDRFMRTCEKEATPTDTEFRCCYLNFKELLVSSASIKIPGINCADANGFLLITSMVTLFYPLPYCRGLMNSLCTAVFKIQLQIYRNRKSANIFNSHPVSAVYFMNIIYCYIYIFVAREPCVPETS